jgi:uncharacterized protein YdeI (YjbR/CyaY-like superfamily)
MKPHPGPILYCSNRREWRSWLHDHFQKENEVWLAYPKKATGKARIPYNDAVEEALCFGWIDSTVKTLDENHTMQCFTPRKAGSSYSQANKERLKWLYDQGLIHPTIRSDVEEILREEFHFPQDILDQIRKDPQVWKNYSQFSPAYRRIRIAYIDSARKRPEEFQKRLNHFIRKTRENKQIGYGGIDKYY